MGELFVEGNYLSNGSNFLRGGTIIIVLMISKIALNWKVLPLSTVIQSHGEGSTSFVRSIIPASEGSVVID